jgi:serine/threonine protein kinase
MNVPRRDDATRDHGGGATAPGANSSPASVWDSLATSLGGLPHVLLRDTDADGESPSEPPSRPGSAEMPAPGQGPQRLQLLGEIARGGMGAVLKGRDPDLCRDLAVKVLLNKHRDDPGLICRFVEEAQITGQLQHPGIAPVYRLGMLPDRRPYFTMKLVKGRTLAALLAERAGRGFPDHCGDRRPQPEGAREQRNSGVGVPALAGPSIPSRFRLKAGLQQETADSEPPTERLQRLEDLPRFLSVFQQVCRTMAYAHARGVIHRDLKPSNIMVGGFGEVQVMDWGLAKVLAHGEEARPPDALSPPDETVIATVRSGSAGSDLSSAGSVIGTPAYMAPEQARGEIARVDTRADVFALGAILCEILAGRPPYVGRVPAEVQRKAARGDLADALAELDSCGADEELIALARDCLAAEPEDRPRDAGIVADRVNGYLAGVGQRLREAEVERTAAAARAEAAEAAAAVERRARRLTLGLAATVLLLAGAAGGGYAWVESERAVHRAAVRAGVAALEQAAELRATALAASPDQPGPWVEALAAAHRAEDQIRHGEADEPLRQRVKNEVDAIEQGRRAADERAARLAVDRKLLSELESIRGNLADHMDPKQTDAEYSAAFHQAGLDLDSTEPRAAGAWIARRSVPIELASFLDDWAVVRRAAGGDEQALARLVAAARAADPDPWRDALRASSGAQGAAAVGALHKLAGDEKALDAQPAESLRLLALRLKSVGDRDSAARLLRQAWRLRPDDFWVNYELARAPGAAYGSREELWPRPEETIRYLTAAVAVRPRSAMARYVLGLALVARGEKDQAIAELREASRLHPSLTDVHANLGAALHAQGKLDEALAALRTARARAGLELETRFPGIGQTIAWMERLVRLRGRLPAILKGQDQPTGPSEGIDFAELCYKQGRHAASARLYAEALTADPKLGEDRRTQHRYNAACAAALAGGGKGKDDPAPDEAARTKFLSQALDWLRAELGAWGRILDGSDAKARAGVTQTLQHWKADNDLAGVRDPDALSKLPEAERKAWQVLWADVDRLLQQARGKP